MRLRLAHFDPAGPLDRVPLADVCSAAHKASGSPALLLFKSLDLHRMSRVVPASRG